MNSNSADINQGLIDRLKAGDETAIKQILKLYSARLLYFATNAIGNSMDAEDLVQEVFINFWTSIKEKGNFEGSVQAYLYRSVRNRCLNYLQRRKMLAEKNNEIVDQFYTQEQQRLDELVVKQELYHQVSLEFERLTSVQMQVMQLLFVDGLTVQETADQLQTTANNVRNHKARAMERLKAVIKNQSPLFIFFCINFLLFAVMKWTIHLFHI